MSVALVISAIATANATFVDSQYRLYNARLSKSDFPYVFDGRQVRMVKVLNIKDANTEANKAACAKEWRTLAAYRQLCLGLSDHRILDVEVTQYPIPISMQVPVVRIAKVNIGQHALVRMPEISPTEAVKSLPTFLGMLADREFRRSL
ncbi:hypothetical protein [Noviherbaspirillum malthae]|uniref:hypothetical protein n=1 Tax=Noviherbaspirillum malthae TaxID=1260987 RepID=UPI00188E48F5|nr:hypothetical protein [Noviherbaspirillum malthae]